MASGDSPAPKVRLEQIQAITDSALAHMGVEDMLDEVLDRVREILAVDIAVVLMLDSSSRQLVATAAKGLEEAVLQSIRVPVGGGVAGRVAASREPVITEYVGSGDVVNPLLIRRGIRSLLGVPLIGGGALLGVLHVGTFSTRRFTADEVEFLQFAADRAATALQSLWFRAEHEAARELQRSLLPDVLPAIPGVELAARYSAGSVDVGGDWYDVFAHPSGGVCVAMGDVAGHGLRAATVMGRLRSALRAYALDSSNPAEVLQRLDRKIQYFEPEATATVLFAVCDPSLESVRVSSAGHWPPVLASPGRATAFVDMTSDPLLGVDDTAPRHVTTVRIPRSAVLCLYTDGLVERRGKPIDVGLAKLRETLFLGGPEAVCAEVMEALIGQEPAEDDVALLVLRRDSSG